MGTWYEALYLEGWKLNSQLAMNFIAELKKKITEKEDPYEEFLEYITLQEGVRIVVTRDDAFGYVEDKEKPHAEDALFEVTIVYGHRQVGGRTETSYNHEYNMGEYYVSAPLGEDEDKEAWKVFVESLGGDPDLPREVFAFISGG